MTERPFDNMAREYRPLRHLLVQWAYVPETNVNNLRKAHFDASTDDGLESSWRNGRH